MPLLQTSGNVTADGYGGGVAAVPNYIEDVFSTYLYTGNNGSQTITNNIDLSTKGGMVWIKNRQTAADHDVTDTARGAKNPLFTNRTYAQDTNVDYAVNSFLTNGFTLNSSDVLVNALNQIYASWTFRKQPKFFDVVTYTGNETAGKTVNHSLGSDPGCIIIKRISPSGYNWFVYHRSNPTKYTNLNLTNAETNFTIVTSVSSTNFTLPADASTNANGIDYVAYLFAHNAAGFGLTGTDNVISCGSFTTDSGGAGSVTLGYEPQWIMYKRTDSTSNWTVTDNMRGLGATYSSGGVLFPNTSGVETGTNALINATGFTASESGSANYIYIAIRRGPMKVPTSGTSVFSPNYASSTTGQQITTGFPVDSQILRYLPSGIGGYWFDRLRGVSTTTTESGQALYPNATTAETTENYTRYFNNTGYQQNSGFAVGTQMIGYSFGRAPSFFDEVCYTGTGSATTQTHNLGVVPELMIVKRRSGAANWPVYSAASGNTKYQYLNSTLQADTFNMWNNTTPTASVFSISGDTDVNGSGSTYVAYLFATCAGVSKVGSYTGTGTTKQIDCGFTGGARFVLIKRTDSTGDWYVWDSARGIVAGNDPYLLLNSTAAEVTNTDYVDTYSAGFEISSTAPAAINASGGTFIFLAIA